MTVSLTSQLKTINENTVHRYAVIWRLIRVDGTIFRFTDHNTDITYKSQVYKAAIGFGVSATQLSSGMSESNKTAEGILIPVGVAVDGFTESDIRGGKYRGAAITEKLIDWKYPWLDELYMTRYTLADIINDGFGFKAEMISQAKFLRLPVGKIYNRNCRHNLGSTHHHRASNGTTLTKFNPGCGKALTGGSGVMTATYNSQPLQQTTAVTEVTLARNTFRVDKAQVSPSYLDGVWRYGTIKFTSGLNIGVELAIASSTVAVALTSDSQITLFIDAPYDIAVADTCIMTVGCDKTHSSCTGKFDNLPNFGGFPDIPGMDRAMFIPDRV